MSEKERKSGRLIKLMPSKLKKYMYEYLDTKVIFISDLLLSTRIRIARVREYDYDEAVKTVDTLTELSMQVRIPEMVRLMKKTVPEFKSQNSVFEIYDKGDQ